MSVSIFGMPSVTPASRTVPLSSPSCSTSCLGVPADALAAVADLVHQRAERGEALVHVRVVALDHRDLRRGLAGDQLALAALPVLHVERLRQFARRVVHQRRQHHFLLDAEVARRTAR